MAVPTPSVPDDFEEKAAPGKGSFQSPSVQRVQQVLGLGESFEESVYVPCSGADSLILRF